MTSVVLRPYQLRCQALIDAAFFRGTKSIVACLPTGAGKCHAPGTPVLLHDGAIKMVEDVVVGDLLMGPDSQPRRVTSLASGQEMMYRVIPTKGDAYVVNESHILSLKSTPTEKSPQYACQRGGKIVNITIKEYLTSSKTFKHTHKGWRTGVEFGPRSVDPDLPPYMLGLWLGDGTDLQPDISKPDQEVRDYVYEYCISRGMTMRESKAPSGCPTYHTVGNKLRVALRGAGVLGNKHIPYAYKVNDRHTRLEVLAGLMDSDGHLRHGYYDFVSKNRALAEDLCFLARSLGFAAYMKPCRKQCTNNGVWGDYFRVSVAGNVEEIPCRIPRKKAQPRQQKKSVLVTGIRVEPVGVGDYYGFTVEGPDRLYLLGDFTVVHNTLTLLDYVVRKVKGGERVAWFAHRKELIDQPAQTARRLGFNDFTVLQGVPKDDFKCVSPLVFCSIQKAMRTASHLNDPTLVVVDECHLAPSPRYLETLMRWSNTAKFIGLSATPDRDGLGKLFQEIIHPVLDSELVEAGVLVPARLEGVDNRTRVRWEDAGPNWEPIRLYKEHCIRDGRHMKTLVFCNTRAQNATMIRELEAAGATVAEVHGEMPKKLREKVLLDLREGRLTCVVNCGVLTAGYDDTSLEAILLMAPCLKATTYVQIAGRVRRAHPGKTEAVIIDMTGAYTDHGRPDVDMWYPLDDGQTSLPCPNCGADLERQEWVLKRDKECEACQEKDGAYRHCPKCGWHFAIPEKGKGEGLTPKERTEFPPAMITLIDAITSRVPGMVRTERGIQKALKSPFDKDKATGWQVDNVKRDDETVKKATYYAMISYRRKLNAELAKKGQRPHKFGWCAMMYKGWYGSYPPRNWTEFLRQPDERLWSSRGCSDKPSVALLR